MTQNAGVKKSKSIIFSPKNNMSNDIRYTNKYKKYALQNQNRNVKFKNSIRLINVLNY